MSKHDHRASDSICWTCQNATGFCTWSNSFTLVKCCKAVKTDLAIKANKTIENYIILDCPQYLADTRQEINARTLSEETAIALERSPKTIYQLITSDRTKLYKMLDSKKLIPLKTKIETFFLDKTI